MPGAAFQRIPGRTATVLISGTGQAFINNYSQRRASGEQYRSRMEASTLALTTTFYFVDV